MSDDGRKIFSMETALGVIAEQENPQVRDLLAFAIGRPVCQCCIKAVSPMVKGWLMCLQPNFFNLQYNGNVSFTIWAEEQKAKFGDNVSITPIPANDVKGMHALLDLVDEAKRTATEKTEEADAANEAAEAAKAEAKALAPFKKKAEDLQQKVAGLEEAAKGLTADMSKMKTEMAAFDGKVAINDKEIEKAVKDIITKAVGTMSFAAAGAAGAAAGAAAAEEEVEAVEEAGGVPDTFGFGTSGSDGDGFGF